LRGSGVSNALIFLDKQTNLIHIHRKKKSLGGLSVDPKEGEMPKSQKPKVSKKQVKAPATKGARKKSPPKKATAASSGIKKDYLKNKGTCKVTFKLPKIAAPEANSVFIVGEFNDWNIYASPMKKLKNGNSTITLTLQAGRDYQFRYLIDESRWENDWNADKYVKGPFGDSDNSVIIL
jgi:hypothetical protein